MYKTIEIEAEGIGQGLLMNSAAGMGSAGKAPARSGKSIPAPEEEARSKLYSLADGQLFAPADWFREAANIASKQFRDRNRRGNASYLQRFQSSVFLSTAELPLVRAASSKAITDGEEDWEIYIKRVVVQGQGVMRARPMVRNLPEEDGGPWLCIVEFEYDEDTISPPEIAMIVAQAGKFPGVGDYRPGRGGPFGRYQVNTVTVNDETVEWAMPS
jgi:hypothetical protein